MSFMIQKTPKIRKGELFPNIVALRKGVKHYDMNRGFEFANFKTNKSKDVLGA